MRTVLYVVGANYEWGGDDIGVFESLAAATEATTTYLAELERDAATGEEIEEPRSITLMPQVDGREVPTQSVIWLFPGWTNEPAVQDILDDYTDLYQ
jgi:hypothetical protein